MDSAVFAGVFKVKDQAYASSLPVHNASGYWQAWEMANQDVMVQPLDYDLVPWGAVYVLSGQEFSFLFMLVSPPGSEAVAALEMLRADTPDLLGVWYEQAVAEEQDADAPDSRQAPESFGGALPAEAQPASLANSATEPFEESLLMPPWHPDDLFIEEGLADEGRQGLAHSSPPAPPRPVPSAAPRQDRKEEEKKTLSVQEALEDDAYVEARAQRLEELMRKDFTALMAKLDANPHADLEHEFSRLITRGAGFTWKQKFMFTEFGLALRRKHLHKLALACHLRALGFAPADEHVLFNVARSEYELGNANAARMHLHRALESAPTFGAAKNFLAFLEGSTQNR